jgi:azurin
MKFINIIASLALILFIGCGGGESDQEESQSSAESQETEMATDDVRTIETIGIDAMKFVIEDEDTEGITLGDPVGSDNLPLLESITVEPGEEIRIVLITRSDLPASAMAHNWILLTMDADGQAFANAASQAKDNDYIPEEMSDQIIAQTGLAAGGETTEVTFTAPEEPGDYEFVCSFPGHYAASMKGILKVEEPSS